MMIIAEVARTTTAVAVTMRAAAKAAAMTREVAAEITAAPEAMVGVEEKISESKRAERFAASARFFSLVRC
jgi:hypothetical protein